MKRIMTIALLMSSVLFCASCQKEHAKNQKVTYYASIDLTGGDEVTWEKGNAWVEPGYSAVLDGKDVTAEIEVENPVDVNQSGVYYIDYSYTNEDGFTSSVSRKVIVLNSSDPVEGFYTTSPESYRMINGAKTVFGASFTILVTGNANGDYDVDDLLGGYYRDRAGYGSDYACGASIKIGDGGALTLISSRVPGWGDSAESVEGTYNESSSTFEYCAIYAGMEFHITMTKE